MNVIYHYTNNNLILCSEDDWQTAHQILQAKTVNWTCSVPFGIVYSKNRAPVVK